MVRQFFVSILVFLAWASFAHAGIFDDKEARQQILDLQQKIDNQQQVNQAALDEIRKSEKLLQDRVTSLENIIKSQGLMDMLNQVDTLNQEVSRLRGQIELLQHSVEIAQQHQKELYADTDGRLRKLESVPTPAAPVPTPAAELPNAPSAPSAPTVTAQQPAQTGNSEAKLDEASESKAFADAMALLKAGRYKDSFDAFNNFIQVYHTSKQMPEALFGLAFSQFSLKNYKAAMATHQKLIADFPDSPKIPEAKFNMANCQIQLSDIAGAKATLKALIAEYPSHEIIPNAKRRLSVLESIK
jgi:tol-pal system protein YbgF